MILKCNLLLFYTFFNLIFFKALAVLIINLDILTKENLNQSNNVK